MLEGTRVLDLTDEKGMLCARLLADLGADVVKVERPGGDAARRIGPFYRSRSHPERSLYWFALNLGKRAITLDLDAEDGRRLFRRLAKTADILVESFAPGYLDGIGLGYTAMAELCPRLVYTSISPFGHQGPYRHWLAPDIVAEAMGGHMYLMGDPDRPPVRISCSQAYFNAGAQACFGSILATYFRDRTGRGQHVDVSIQESVLATTQDAALFWDLTGSNVRRNGALRRRPDTGAATPFVWQVRDGFVAFAMLGGQTFAASARAFVAWMSSEGQADQLMLEKDWEAFDWATTGQAEIDPIVERVQRFLLQHTKEETVRHARHFGVMLQPVNTPAEILRDGQLAARQSWETVYHPELDATIIYPREPFRFSGKPPRTARPAPLIGQHNEEIYAAVLGLSAEEIRTLQFAGVI